MTTSDKLCEHIAQSIRNGFYYAGEFSGFKASSADQIEKHLLELVAQIKKEILEELKRS